jgi:hypothetical protein
LLSESLVHSLKEVALVWEDCERFKDKPNDFIRGIEEFSLRNEEKSEK